MASATLCNVINVIALTYTTFERLYNLGLRLELFKINIQGTCIQQTKQREFKTVYTVSKKFSNIVKTNIYNIYRYVFQICN